MGPLATLKQMPISVGKNERQALRSILSISWVRGCFSLLAIFVADLSVYFPVVLRRASVMTDTSRWPTGPLFVGDPAAGGQITYYKELAVAQAWHHMHLPLWLPTEGYGITLAGNQAAPWFLPEVVLHLLVPGNFSLWNVLCVILASLGAYFLARHLGLGNVPSIAAALIYGLSGPMVANLNLDMINPIAVTPYAILAALRLVETSSDRGRYLIWWAAAAFSISQLFLAGFAEVLPLEMILISLFVLGRSGYIARSRREFLRLIARWVGAAIVGVAGSLIASVSLMLPLSTYQLFQPVGAELAAEPKYWWLTLVDPWAFGRGLAAGPFQAGHTVWAPGNPLIFMFAAAAVLGLLKVPRGWGRGWRIVMAAIMLFGILGFANALGVLNILRLPPLSLIYSPRFLPFVWWLPAALMAGAGLEAVGEGRRYLGLVALAVTTVATGILVADVFVKGGTIFPAIDSKNLTATIRSNLPVGMAFAVGVIIIVSAPRRWRSMASLVALGGLVLLLVPRNFFPVAQAPQQLASVAMPIRAAGLGNGLSFSPGDYTVPSGLIGLGIPSIQAFDVFFPKGYANTVAHYFGDGNAMSTASPLYPAAPSMIDVPVNDGTIPLLRKIGVETIVLPYRLDPANLATVAIVREPKGLGFSAASYTQALHALVSVYLSRPDLERSFPLVGSQWGLVAWPMVGARAQDSSAISLEQFFPVYRSLLAVAGTESSFRPFRLVGGSSLRSLDIRRLAVGNYLGTKEYIYVIGGSANAVPVVGASSVRPYPAAYAGAPIPLDGAVAYVSPSVAKRVGNPSQLVVKVSGFSESASGLRFSLDVNHRGLVFLRRQIAPGERILINGRRVGLVSVDNFLTGFIARAGSQRIVISYASPLLLVLFWSGLLINVFLVVMICVLWFCVRGRSNRAAGVGSPSLDENASLLT